MDEYDVQETNRNDEIKPTPPERKQDPWEPAPDSPPFVKVPTLRGIYEIRPLIHMVYSLGGIICGGYVRYCCSPKLKPHPAGDVDVYSPNDDVFELLKKAFEQQHKLSSKHENAMAITYRRPSDGPFAYAPDIQLIKPFKEGRIVAVGNMEEILGNFDFSIVRAGLLSETEALVDKFFMMDEAKGSLRLMNIHCPVSSTLRCIKYGHKGYYLRPFEAMKLFLDWDRRDLDYREKLIDFFMKLEGKQELTREEIDSLEALLRID